MDKKVDISASQAKEGKSGLSWNKEYVIFIFLPIILIILVSLGGLPYLCGRLNFHIGVLCMTYPVIGFFIIFGGFNSQVQQVNPSGLTIYKIPHLGF
jgi:hypothetical protein